MHRVECAAGDFVVVAKDPEEARRWMRKHVAETQAPHALVDADVPLGVVS